MMPRSLGTCLFFASVLSSTAFAADEVPFCQQSAFRFASVEEATEVMTARDDFIETLSRFDLEARLRRREPVSTELLLAHIPKQILEWTDEDRKTLQPVLEQVREQLANWELPFPETVLLIKTSGQEDAGAAYCRGNAIVLPQSYVERVNASVMLHELFHVLSRHNPPLREELYRVVGFTIGSDVQLPEVVREIKITNPDAPRVNCYIQLEHDGQAITATPLITSTAKHFDPQPGRTLFNYLNFRLLVVEQQGDMWQAKLDERGKPILLDPESVPSYFEQIGRNTKYIIHPEEVLADNFVLLVQGKTDVATPRILERMQAVLAE